MTTKLLFNLFCSIIAQLIQLNDNKAEGTRGMGVENTRWDAAYKLDAYRNPFRVNHAC